MEVAMSAAAELHKRERLARKSDRNRIEVDSSKADSLLIALAEVTLIEIGLNGKGQQTYVRWAESWWHFVDGHHRPVEEEDMRARIWDVLCRVDVKFYNAKKEKTEKRKLDPKSTTVTGVADAMTAVADRVGATHEIPCVLSGYDGPPPSKLAILRNGHLELDTLTLHPSTPRLFTTAGAAVDYVPGATCPSWELFLRSIFTDDEGTDEETIRLLRQVFGWLIAGDTSRHTIPIIVGPPRSGKSTMMTVLRALLGEDNVAGPPLASLAESRFGLAPLLGKTAAIIPDARLSNRADQAAVAGLLLMVSGRDAVEIDRKGQRSINVRLGCRLLIVTNELPRINDASGALSSRFLIVETRQSFLGKEDRGLEDRLRAELPGILAWAIEGWRDLEANGWVKPRRSVEAQEELDRLGSPTRAFIADRLVVMPGAEISIDVLYREWTSWCEANGRKEPGTVQTFARDLRAAVPPGVRASRPNRDGRRTVTYYGISVQSGVRS